MRVLLEVLFGSGRLFESKKAKVDLFIFFGAKS
jgi:hypothetical protein